MQIRIFNEAEATHLALEAGFENVEEYVNRMIKESADLEAIREGITDVEAGRVTPLAEFDAAFREEMGFSPRSGS